MTERPSRAAALLQLARLRAGLSQRELAARAGVPAEMISAYERDKRQPTLPTLERLLRAAGFELRTRIEPYNPADEGGPADESVTSAWQGAASRT